MLQLQPLQPLTDLIMDRVKILAIQRDELVLILDDHYRLNKFAEHNIQAQAGLLMGVDPQLTQQFTQTIEHIIQALAYSKKVLKPKKYNALQRWFGKDLEHKSLQLAYYQDLDQLLKQADHLSHKLQYEIQQAQLRLAQVSLLRVEMAHYIVAAREFLKDYPQFQRSGYDHFIDRLSQKINSLQTLQAHNDIAIAQMQVTQQLSFSLLDRYKEAQHVLIPAWQYHVKQSQHAVVGQGQKMAQLDQSREQLIQTLQKSLEKSHVKGQAK